jgi:hypothetical protein
MLMAVRPGMPTAISVIVMILITAGLMRRLMVDLQLIMAVRLANQPIMIMIPSTQVMV